jgi:hypothetical protein
MSTLVTLRGRYLPKGKVSLKGRGDKARGNAPGIRIIIIASPVGAKGILSNFSCHVNVHVHVHDT